MVRGFTLIVRSSDFCDVSNRVPAPACSPSFAPNYAHPTVRFGGNDNLWLAFNYNDDNGETGTGLVAWREQ